MFPCDEVVNIMLKRSIYSIYVLTLIFLVGCSAEFHSSTQMPTNTFIPSFTAASSSTITPTSTNTPIPTETATPTLTPTETASFTPTETATTTLTPTVTLTPSPPQGILKVERAHCRYGPGAAYLHEYGLLQGIPVEIQGRTDRGDWLYVLPLWFETSCWIKADLLEISGDIFRVEPYYGILPFSDNYPPPYVISVTRTGDEVTVSWSDVRMTEDKYRGYLIETWICQDGELVFTPVNIDGFMTKFTDEPGCDEPSRARIYSAQKQGYSKWRIIPWPSHEPTPKAIP